MTILQLRAANVRCLRKVELTPSRQNLIFGENASGKTSLLEAIFVMGRGRSFRGGQRQGLISDGETEALMSATVRKGLRSAPLGLTINRGGQARIRVAGRDAASVATLAEWLPVQVLDPDLHRLVEEGPSVRRRYLDWGVFHVEHRFLDIWRRYHRSLRQRNALLKRKQPRELDAWDERLAAEGEALDKCRRSYLTDVVTDINRFAETLLGARLDLQYVSGWSAKDNFGAALIAARDRDVRFGSTTVGPHRADIRIDMADKKARGRVSRGQQKLLASSLVLGQLRHLERTRDIKSVLLLDDAAAELDRQGLDRLMSAASTLAGQLFVTALQREHLAHTEGFAVFHVERGEVSSVV